MPTGYVSTEAITGLPLPTSILLCFVLLHRTNNYLKLTSFFSHIIVCPKLEI